MGNEFFDGLGETITRTAKELGERAEMLYESQRIRNKLSGEERIVDKVMADLGNLVYKRYSGGEAVDEELKTLCEEIDQHTQKIMEYKESMANLKGQKICPSCQKAVDRDVAYCPFCGATCPTPEPEEEAGDVIEPEDTEDAAQAEESEGNCACGSGGAPECPAEDEGMEESAEEPVAEENTENKAEE